MPWLQLRINCKAEDGALCEKALQHAGALSITFEDNADQPILEPALGETPLWNETRVTGLYEADCDTKTIEESVSSILKEAQTNLYWHVLEDKDWEREWMSQYAPIQCHERLWICPSWCEAPEPSTTNLMLDPGLAFGTGSHPTTFLCLQWLAEQTLDSAKLVDYGCGSGILGIASLLLGAKQVWGVDIDPQALLATRDNVIRNNLHIDQFPVFLPQNAPEIEVDIVLANILAGPLVELAPLLLSMLKPGGKICLSGVLKTQEADLIAAYKHQLEITDIRQREEWICLSGIKSA